MGAGGGMMKLADLDNSPFAMFVSFVSFLIVIIFITILVVYIFIFPGKSKTPEPGLQPEAGPSIYITRTGRFLTPGGETVWILEYTVDGRFQSPAFHSQEAMAEYREYLDTIGKVYRREEETE
jgi:hypothetical protein